MSRRAILVAGLGYGDEGKGSIVDHLARKYNAHAVFRYNGGAQAAHNVVTPEGVHHTFSQFGSGTFAGARTHLSRFMLVYPHSLLREGVRLQNLGITDAFDLMTIDKEALLITPFQIAANRLLETARSEKNKHGTCGMGIGKTMQDYLRYGANVLFAGDLADPDTARKKMEFIQNISYASVADLIPYLKTCENTQGEINVLTDKEWVEKYLKQYMGFAQIVKIVDGKEYLSRLMRNDGTVIFEGAQGVLLDQQYGFHPYITWTDITYRNAHTLLQEIAYDGEVSRLGILRAYATRHGHGPFVTEDQKLKEILPDTQNENNNWQGNFRVGHFDAVSARYALDVIGGIDSLALTHLDRIQTLKQAKICKAYRMPDQYDGFIYNQSGDATEIVVKRPPINTHQEALTRYLQQATPIYGMHTDITTHAQAHAYGEKIANLLETRLSILSFGTTADDKHIV